MPIRTVVLLRTRRRQLEHLPAPVVGGVHDLCLFRARWPDDASRTPSSGRDLEVSELFENTIKVVSETGHEADPVASGQRLGRVEAVEHLSHADRIALGKAARSVAPLESHAEFVARGSRDPVGLLAGQAESRVPELVPVRHGRMLVSAFAFYRGAALPMAADLASTP